MRYAIDAKKIAKELNFIPSIEIDAGLMKTVQWYVKNKDWLNNVTSGEYIHYYKKMYNNEK